MIYHDGYDDFDGLEGYVRRTVEHLSEHRRKFDSIVVTGVSGQCVGFPVALQLEKPIIVRRKPSEQSHSSDSPGGLVNRKHMGQRVLFLDDFISNGDTFAAVKEIVELYGGAIVGAYLYRDGELAWAGGYISRDGSKMLPI